MAKAKTKAQAKVRLEIPDVHEEMPNTLGAVLEQALSRPDGIGRSGREATS